MAKTSGPDIAAKRLSKSTYAANFADLHEPLSSHEALVESDRCFFCYDAPCQTACPTSIDIPLFIREIQAGHEKDAAVTIFNQNILGGMCARVCPTETLCEEACVRNTSEDKPVKIGLLQRFATDAVMAEKIHPYTRAKKTGKHVAVLGAGPAGLACAHRLAMYGHAVTIYEVRKKSGGLNEYGIAAYKSVDDFARREVNFILAIGGINIINGKKPKLVELQKNHDAVFVGIGLSGVNDLGIKNDDVAGIEDAVDYISDIRQSTDLSKLKVGRRVLVIGGGMTAIDVAVQSKLLGAEDVTILYRRGAAQMKASSYEQQLAQIKGVKIKHWVAPIKVITKSGVAIGLTCAYMAEKKGLLAPTGETVDFEADTIFKAIGQSYVDALGGAVKLQAGRIAIDGEKRTSVSGVWAGGDCAAGGKDLTVAAVDDGRRAAESIHAYLTA